MGVLFAAMGRQDLIPFNGAASGRQGQLRDLFPKSPLRQLPHQQVRSFREIQEGGGKSDCEPANDNGVCPQSAEQAAKFVSQGELNDVWIAFLALVGARFGQCCGNLGGSLRPGG